MGLHEHLLVLNSKAEVPRKIKNDRRERNT